MHFLLEPIQIVTALTIVLMLLGLVAAHRICSILRVRHVEQWRELGAPAIFTNFSLGIQWKFSSFIWMSRYRSLNDRSLNRLGVAVKLDAIALVICLGILAM